MKWIGGSKTKADSELVKILAENFKKLSERNTGETDYVVQKREQLYELVRRRTQLQVGDRNIVRD